MHIPIYLQTVTMTHERRITRYHSIFKVIVIDNGFTRHIRGFAMMCQFIIHNIFALVLVKLVIEQKIVIFRVEFVHRITEHQVLGFSSRHLRFPETEFVDTSFKVFSYDKWLRCLRNNCSTGIGNPLFLFLVHTSIPLANAEMVSCVHEPIGKSFATINSCVAVL